LEDDNCILEENNDVEDDTCVLDEKDDIPCFDDNIIEEEVHVDIY